MLLWAASWHQLPAGSLPDNDTVLMRLVGLGRDHKTWKRHKPSALRGFVTCRDGRLYHPVVAEQVREAWRAKIEQRWRSECARVKKHNQRHNTDVPAPTFEEFKAARYAPVPADTTILSRGTTAEQSRGTSGPRDRERDRDRENNRRTMRARNFRFLSLTRSAGRCTGNWPKSARLLGCRWIHPGSGMPTS